MRLFVGPALFFVVRRGGGRGKLLQTGNRFYFGWRSLLPKLQPLGHQKAIKTAKSVVAFIFLVMVWLIAATVECDLALHFGILCSVFVSVLALFMLLGALLRAPEAYEDENGFHIGALAGAALS
jgi:hypothetical protein